MLYEVIINGKDYRLELNRPEGEWSCRIGGCEIELDAVLIRPGLLSLRIGNRMYEIKTERVENKLHVWVGDRCFTAEVRDPRPLRGRTPLGEGDGPRNVTASMPGRVVRLMVQPGEKVELGAGLAVLEAMKMQNEIKSPKKGVVAKVLVREGAPVNAGDVLLIVD